MIILYGMIFVFRCRTCKNEFEETTMAHGTCPKCKSLGDRVFTSPQTIVKKGYPKFNLSLGKVVNSKGDEDRQFEKLGAVKI